MKQRNLDNRALDTIGRKLFESEVKPSNNVEKLISNPQLFALVRAKIAANGKTPSLNTQTGGLALSFIRQNAFAFAGGALALVIATVAVSFFRSENTLVAVTKVKVPDAVPEVARPEVPPNPFVGKLSAGRASNREFSVENAVVRTVSKTTYRKPQNLADRAPDDDFYALALPGERIEPTGDGRIIRVDMPRSSLFALGVNVPLENGPEIVKADLLVGPDGVTRAIRVVKQID